MKASNGNWVRCASTVGYKPYFWTCLCDGVRHWVVWCPKRLVWRLTKNTERGVVELDAFKTSKAGRAALGGKVEAL